MDSRKVKICYYLSKHKTVRLSILAKLLNKSERTIRNDINDINIFLRKYINKKIKIDNKIISFPGNEKEIINILDNLSYSEYYLDSIERRIVIIVYGILKKDYFTIEELSDFMYVSKSTVVNDIDRIKQFIDNFNYELISLPSLGNFIRGKENAKNFELVNEIISFDLDNISRFFKQKDLFKILNNKNLSEDYIEKIKSIIKRTEQATNYKLSLYSYKLLSYFLAIYLQISNFNNNAVKIENKFVQVLIANISDDFNLELNTNNFKDISLFINKLNFLQKTYNSADSLKAQVVTSKFLEKISKILNINFMNDAQLIAELSNHLSLIIDNPILKVKEYTEISKYADNNINIKNAVIESLNIIKKFINRSLNDVEINFIVIYLLVALERMKNSIKDIHILLICASGISTSYLIRENLNKIIPNANIEIAGIDEYYSNNISMNYDLILSTIALNNFNDYLHINTILDMNDISKILNKIDQIKIKKLKNSNKIYKVKNIIKSKNSKKLSKFFNSENMKFNVEADNWKEAIKKSAQYLLDNEFIEENYIDEMIKNVENYGSYIVITEGIAIPHASADFGVNKTGMSLIKLKNSIKFEDDDNPVSYFICLSSNDNEHFDALMKLNNGLKNQNFKNLFMEAQNEYELLNVIKLMEN